MSLLSGLCGAESAAFIVWYPLTASVAVTGPAHYRRSQVSEWNGSNEK